MITSVAVDSESVVARELSGSERLLWSGRPRQGFVLRSSDVFMIPFSFVWGGFAIFWEYRVLSGGAPLPMALFGLLFVAMGIHMIAGRFFADAFGRKHTYYGVTSERIIIVSGWLSRRVKTLNLRTLTDVSSDVRSDGRGTITFGPQNPLGWWNQGGAIPGAGGDTTPSFTEIPDAKRVYEIVRTAQQSTGRS